MPEFDLTLVDAVDFLKNCGLTGDEAAVQAESLLRNRNGLLFETSTGSHCDETDSNDSYDSMDGLEDLAAMIVHQNSAALNCGLSDHEATAEAESLLRNRNVRLYDTSGGRSDNDVNETDSEDSYDVLDHIDLEAMIARQTSAHLNRKDELQQDYEKDDATLKVRHRQFIEKKLKDANNEWRGPAEWDADMHDNFQERDRISGGKAYEIALELGMNSS